jgi:hypothetical protein
VFQWLEQAYERRVWRIIELTLPIFDPCAPIRVDRISRRIGLPN